jgi:hypothetical protein
MSLLSHLSPDGAKNGAPLPLPADARLLALGEDSWREALAAAEDTDAAAAARGWSSAPAGRRCSWRSSATAHFSPLSRSANGRF